MPDGGLVVADLVGRISFLDKSDQVYGHIGDNPDPKLRARNGIPRARWRDARRQSAKLLQTPPSCKRTSTCM